MAIKTGFNDLTYEAGEAVGADSHEIWYLEADDSITKGLFVELVTAGHVKDATGTVGAHTGIALASGVDGDIIPVLVAGYGTVTADTTGVAIGDYIKPDTAAKATKATFGSDKIVAIAANASASNGGVAVVKLMALGA